MIEDRLLLTFCAAVATATMKLHVMRNSGSACHDVLYNVLYYCCSVRQAQVFQMMLIYVRNLGNSYASLVELSRTYGRHRTY